MAGEDPRDPEVFAQGTGGGKDPVYPAFWQFPRSVVPRDEEVPSFLVGLSFPQSSVEDPQAKLGPRRGYFVEFAASSRSEDRDFDPPP